MKRVGEIAVCLAGGLAFVASVRADNPYMPIVARNVFGLNPPQAADSTQQNTEPPPKITANGIMSIFGHWQVLFKVVTPGRPGQPAKDTSYILSEGQQQDDIEVIQINEKKGVVKFDNHGTVQEIALTSTPAAGGAAPAAVNLNPMPSTPKVMLSGGGGGSSNSGDVVRFGDRLSRNRGSGNGNNNLNPGADNGSGLRSIPAQGGYSNPQSKNNLSADDQAVLIAAQHKYHQDQGSPIANLFPPTKYDPEAGVAPPPPPGGSSSR
jgi:hypothetical protein